MAKVAILAISPISSISPCKFFEQKIIVSRKLILLKYYRSPKCFQPKCSLSAKSFSTKCPPNAKRCLRIRFRDSTHSFSGLPLLATDCCKLLSPSMRDIESWNTDFNNACCLALKNIWKLFYKSDVI